MKKLLLIEPYHGGHHTNYIEALLPNLYKALTSGLLSQVVIAITARHFEHLKQESAFTSVQHSNLVFDTNFLEVSPAPSFVDRIRLFRAINQAVKQHQPDALIVPSADYDVMVNALLKPFARFGRNTSTRAVGIFHYGMPKPMANGLKEQLKQAVYEAAWRFCCWDQLMMVNPVMYERLKQQGGALASRLTLLPDPAPDMLTIDPLAARKALELPEQGLLMGFAGMMDDRKAIPELLQAFEALLKSNADKEVYLVLAGRLDPAYQAIIDSRYQHLVDNGRLIVMSRYLSHHEVQLAYRALDVVTLLQYKRANLSANLIKAMCNDKPIIADGYGYTGMMLDRFALGYACRVNAVDTIVEAMHQALATAQAYEPIAATERLKAFHQADNFANMLLHSLTGELVNGPLLTWDWVCESAQTV